MGRFVILTVAAAFFFASAAQATDRPSQDWVAAYAAAAEIMPATLYAAIRNDAPALNWIGHSHWAWYRRQTKSGVDFVLVDAATGHREPVFDNVAVASALRKGGITADASHLSISNLTFSSDRRRVVIAAGKVVLTWDRMTSNGELSTPPTPRTSPLNVPSPDGRFAVFRRDDNLWLRDLGTGAERPLTSDGAPYFSYAKLPDNSLITVRAMRTGMVLLPIGVVWTPDSKRLIVPRFDERDVRQYSYLQMVPSKGWAPVPYTIRRADLGDAHVTKADLFVIDVATGQKRRVATPAGKSCRLLAAPTWWNASASEYYALCSPADGKSLSLVRIDLTTGMTSTVIDESSATSASPNVAIYSSPNVRILSNDKEVIWFSERSGYGHLYLYRTDGQLLRDLTPGSSVVFDLIAVDEDHRAVYYTASPAAGEGDPYNRVLYRVSLDGGRPQRLTSTDSDHAIEAPTNPALALALGAAPAPASLSPDLAYFVDIASTVDRAPTTTIRSTKDGHEIAVLETADTTGLKAIGYQPPEPFTVKAADGKTNLYGVIYLPPDRSGARRFPLIDAIYNGPQIANVPHTFTGAFTNAATAPAALARLGFAVFVLDARGTAMRDKAFHDASYGKFADAGMADHISAIKQLGERYPEVDTGRVGVYGASFGGYYAANAVLRHPEVFSAAFAVAGPYNLLGFYAQAMESLQGDPIYPGGSHVNATGYEVATNYTASDLTHLAPNLTGYLALATSDVDENAPPALTFQLADALEKANKSFDLIVMPNHTHEEMWDPYVVRRMWDFFVRNLRHGEPPTNSAMSRN